MENLFYLNNSEDLQYPDGKNISAKQTNAPLLLPTGKGITNIDVVNEFKWTKTDPIGRWDTPTMRLREAYITRSSFIGNLTYAANVFVDSTQMISQFIGNNAKDLPFAGDLIKTGADQFAGFAEKAGKFVGGPGDHLRQTGQKHLGAYYNLYGTRPTNFIYHLPYLQDDWKMTATKFKGGLGSSMASGMFSFAKYMVQGFAMEAAQEYEYPSDGPEIRTTLFLDNTKSDQDFWEGGNSWNKNWQFVFMMAYQNLPNRMNRFLVQPSVVYELRLPGMYYLPYVHLSSLQVKCHGVRLKKDVSFLVGPPENQQKKIISTLIPEAYELNLAFKSLLPETKNLLYESFNDNYEFVLEPDDLRAAEDERNNQQRIRDAEEGANEIRNIAGNI